MFRIISKYSVPKEHGSSVHYKIWCVECDRYFTTKAVFDMVMCPTCKFKDHLENLIQVYKTNEKYSQLG